MERKSSAVEFRSILERVVARGLGDESEVALFLSGGVDSLSLGFAATALKRKVHAYTFRLGARANADSIAAERCAREMGWRFTLVEVPVRNLKLDFVQLGRRYACAKKTQFECTWPFIYLAREVTEKKVLSGIAADGHYGLSKRAMINFRYPKWVFDRFREVYFASESPAGQKQQVAVLEERGLAQIAPYLDREIIAFFRRFSWDELNKPQQKIIVLRAYPDEYRRCGARKHANLQLVSGINSAFESLLKTELNPYKRTRVLDLCRDWSKR